jgi:ABC-2 type transport system ATP-binding protein
MRAYTAAGRTVLFATHYLEEAEAFASRVVIISRGRIVADGTVAELKRSVGIQTVRFRSPQGAPQELDRLPGVQDVERQGEQVTLKTTNADATVRALVMGGIAWQALEVLNASMDDVFMTLVAKSDKGDNR